MRNKLLWATIGFLAGSVTGFTTAFLYLRKKHEESLKEERDSLVKLKREIKENDEILKQSYKAEFDPLIARYEQEVEEQHYTTIDEPETPPDDIMAISPYQFASDANYEKETLTYYDEDDILADEDDNQINPEGVLMKDFYSYFGEDVFGDEDIIYVRNEKNKTDYEVVRSYVHLSDHLDYPGFDDDED